MEAFTSPSPSLIARPRFSPFFAHPEGGRACFWSSYSSKENLSSLVFVLLNTADVAPSIAAGFPHAVHNTDTGSLAGQSCDHGPAPASPLPPPSLGS